MLSFLVTIIKLLLILGVVATIHEFGHFLFAKLFKMGVNEFSIGFGPKIVQKEFKGTMYSLRWIPLGGYCAIEGEEGESQREDAFVNKSAWKKIIVLVAGVLFNAILAATIFIVIALSMTTLNTKITALDENSILSKAGIEVGDEIYSIDGKKVNLGAELSDQKFATEKKDVEIGYIRNGELQKTIAQDAVTNIGYIGVSFLVNSDKTDVTNEIEMVASGGAAVAVGLKAGDKITNINGIETTNSTDIINIIRDNANKEVELTVDRNGEVFTQKITPSSKLNFSLGSFSTEEVKTDLRLAISSAIYNFKSIIGSYVDLFRGKVSVNEMSGIVGIGEVVSKTDDLITFFNLLAIISLAVGVANIMPFPPLDGGKVVIVLIEAITRKKVPVNVEAIISYIGFGFLILLTLFVTYNDIVRIF